MAVAAYTTDLQDIADLDSSGGTAVEPASLWTAGRSPEEADTDFPIQGTVHASLTMNTTGKAGILVPGNSGWSSGDYIFGWVIWLAPGAIANYAGGGLAMLLGDSASVFNVYYVGGNDFGSYPYGGWQNFAVDPEMTPDENAGSPSTFNYVGAGANVSSAVSKGNPLGFDVFRYGRGEIRIVGGTSTDDDATFVGMAAQNDNNSNRWGLFQAIEGGYKFKGLMYFGYGNPTNFTDSNKNIVIDRCDWVATDFNRIEIHNASSVINWTNINITALGTNAKGEFEMIDDATVNFTGCVFTDMSTFIFDSNATIDGCTFRRCGEVTQAGGDFDNCIFDESAAAIALVVDNPDNIDNCTFVSDGTGHAIELGTACAGNSYTLTDFFVSGYAASDGSTGNEVILNSSGGTVTLNIDGGSGVSALSIKGGNVTLVANYSFTVTGLESGTEVTIVTSGTSTVLHHTESAVTSDGAGKYQITYSHGGGATVDVLIHHINYQPDISNIYGLTLPGNNSSAKVKQFPDLNYENP